MSWVCCRYRVFGSASCTALGVHNSSLPLPVQQGFPHEHTHDALQVHHAHSVDLHLGDTVVWTYCQPVLASCKQTADQSGGFLVREHYARSSSQCQSSASNLVRRRSWHGHEDGMQEPASAWPWARRSASGIKIHHIRCRQPSPESTSSTK